MYMGAFKSGPIVRFECHFAQRTAMNNNMRQCKQKKAKQRPRGRPTARNRISRLPMPVSRDVSLPYVEVYSFTTSASTLASWFYYQTSAYDPRGSTFGHQPLYFDQLATLYSRCRVDRVAYEFSVSTPSANGHTAYIRASPTATFETNVELLSERPWTRQRYFNAGGGPITIRGIFKPWQVLGVTRDRYCKDDQFSATTGSNPTLMAYLIPYVYSGPQSGSVVIDVKLKLQIHVHFFELAQPAQS